MYKAIISVTTGGKIIHTPHDPRPIRVMPDGYAGVVFEKKVYPLYKGNTIDVLDESSSRAKCPVYVRVRYFSWEQDETIDSDVTLNDLSPEEIVDLSASGSFPHLRSKPDPLLRKMREALIDYDEGFLRKKFPHILPENRMLRDCIVEILIQKQPRSPEEFAQWVPTEMANNTAEEEKPFLLEAIRIINQCRADEKRAEENRKND